MFIHYVFMDVYIICQFTYIQGMCIYYKSFNNDHNHELYRRHTILKKINSYIIVYNPANHAKKIKQC